MFGFIVIEIVPTSEYDVRSYEASSSNDFLMFGCTLN